jgi:hypothetical protein
MESDFFLTDHEDGEQNRSLKVGTASTFVTVKP